MYKYVSHADISLALDIKDDESREAFAKALVYEADIWSEESDELPCAAIISAGNGWQDDVVVPLVYDGVEARMFELISTLEPQGGEVDVQFTS